MFSVEIFSHEVGLARCGKLEFHMRMSDESFEEGSTCVSRGSNYACCYPINHYLSIHVQTGEHLLKAFLESILDAWFFLADKAIASSRHSSCS
jgi:hypothetical protein